MGYAVEPSAAATGFISNYLSPSAPATHDTIIRARQPRTEGAAKTPRARTLSSQEDTRRVPPEGKAPRPLLYLDPLRPVSPNGLGLLVSDRYRQVCVPLSSERGRARVGMLWPPLSSRVCPRRMALSRRAGVVAGLVEMRSLVQNHFREQTADDRSQIYASWLGRTPSRNPPSVPCHGSLQEEGEDAEGGRHRRDGGRRRRAHELLPVLVAARLLEARPAATTERPRRRPKAGCRSRRLFTPEEKRGEEEVRRQRGRAAAAPQHQAPQKEEGCVPSVSLNCWRFCCGLSQASASCGLVACVAPLLESYRVCPRTGIPASRVLWCGHSSAHDMLSFSVCRCVSLPGFSVASLMETAAVEQQQWRCSPERRRALSHAFVRPLSQIKTTE